jgi:nucleotide-binding universal stress UspA family protein
MSVIVGVDPNRAEQADAIALGVLLARLSDSRLLLVTVYEPLHSSSNHVGAPFEHALRKATAHLRQRLEGLETEQLVLPSASAARALHRLADERRAHAIVVGSSPRATWGHVELGTVSERLLHGGPAATVVAPRGYGSRTDALHLIGAGYAGTPESIDALTLAKSLAEPAGASLRVITVFDPGDYARGKPHADGAGGLRGQAQRELVEAVRCLDLARATGELLDGDPAQTLTRLSAELDLLVVGSRGYGPLRAVLLGDVSRALVHEAACPVMIVPHVPAPDHEVELVGGLEPGAPAFL